METAKQKPSDTSKDPVAQTPSASTSTEQITARQRLAKLPKFRLQGYEKAIEWLIKQVSQSSGFYLSNLLSTSLTSPAVHRILNPTNPIPVRISNCYRRPINKLFTTRSCHKNNLINIPVQNEHTERSDIDNDNSVQYRSKTSYFKFIHLNIRSLRNSAHLIQLKKLAYETKIEVITVSETWLNTTVTNLEVNIEGYKLYRQDRLHKRGGGVCAYIRNDIKVCVLKDISSVTADHFHQFWLKLQCKKLRSVVICVSYRPPECPTSCFETTLMPSYTQALMLNKPILILGDLNCNILKVCPEGTTLENFMLEMNLKQLITTPTRITDISESLLDVIMISSPDLVHESGVMNLPISDHLPVYTVLKLKLPKPPPQLVLTRSYKNYDAGRFSAQLASRSHELVPIFFDSSVSSKLAKFDDVLHSTLEAHAPVKLIKIRHRPSPFVTTDIKNQMTLRDQLHRHYKQTRDAKDWRNFKDAQKSLRHTLKTAEKEHVRTEVNLHKNNPGSLWKVINNRIPSKDKGTLMYSKNPVVIANEFNQFFHSIGKTTARAATQLAIENDFNIPTCTDYPTRTAQHSFDEMFNFTPVTCSEVQHLITSMPSNKCPGPDKISMRIIKDCLPVILGPLTDIINSSFTTSTFPEPWKIAEVLPILKNGDHEIASNNRPLSMLNVASKICEKVALNQFSSFLNHTGRLSCHQSGNKKYHSTETLNILVSDFILNSMDNKKLSAIVLIDLSKAFDSIDHSILLQKLANFGVSRQAINWFSSYLSGRKQYVRIGSSVSDSLPMTHGVPQGALLSPLLFCIYTDDLPRVPQVSKLESFVDDSKIFMSFAIKDASIAKNNIENDLKLVATWCFRNKLLINPEKTKFLLIGTRQLLGNLLEEMTISFLGKEIIPVLNAKDLGLTLDNHLTYDKHIRNVISAAMSKLCQISRVKDSFDSDTLRTIISAIVMSKLYYCSTVWANTSTTNIKKLQAVQNFACRIITNTRKYDHITPALRAISWLPVSEHLRYRDSLMTYKCMHELVPSYLSEQFHKRNEIHDLNTRNKEDLNIPPYKTTTGQRSFHYRAVKIWNSIDNDLKKLPFKTFKIKLKKKMLGNN